jgi:hypothetical protein
MGVKIGSQSNDDEYFIERILGKVEKSLYEGKPLTLIVAQGE